MRVHATDGVALLHEWDKCLHKLLFLVAIEPAVVVDHFKFFLFQVVLAQDNVALFPHIRGVALVFAALYGTLDLFFALLL